MSHEESEAEYASFDQIGDELPDEGMREAVEAVVAVAHGWLREMPPKLATDMLNAALPFLGGLPPKPSEEAKARVAQIHFEREVCSCSGCRTRCFKQADEELSAAYRVDARPFGAPAGDKSGRSD